MHKVHGSLSSLWQKMTYSHPGEFSGKETISRADIGSVASVGREVVSVVSESSDLAVISL